MVEITKLERNEAAQILREHYGITSLLEIEPLKGGMANTSYVCHFADRPTSIFTVMDYFVRRKDLNWARTVGKLMVALNEQGVRAPWPVLTVGEEPVAIVQHGQSTLPVMLKEFVDGECHAYLPEADLFEVGAALARVHKIDISVEPFSLTKPKVGQLPVTFKQSIESFEDREFSAWLAHNHERFCHAFARSGSPTTLVHGDIFADNIVLTADRQVVILDWELGSLDCRLFDVAMSILGLCREEDCITYSPNRKELLLSGYNSAMGENALTELEMDCLNDAIGYCAVKIAFWRYMLNNASAVNKGDQRYRQMMLFLRSLQEHRAVADLL